MKRRIETKTSESDEGQSMSAMTEELQVKDNDNAPLSQLVLEIEAVVTDGDVDEVISLVTIESECLATRAHDFEITARNSASRMITCTPALPDIPEAQHGLTTASKKTINRSKSPGRDRSWIDEKSASGTWHSGGEDEVANGNNDEEGTSSNHDGKKKKKNIFSRMSSLKINKSITFNQGLKVKKVPKKKVRVIAREADETDAVGNDHYYSKRYKDATESYEEAYRMKKIVYGEEAPQIAYAVEKLAKAEDMLIFQWKDKNVRANQGTEVDDAEAANNRASYRIRASTHYNEAFRLSEANDIDCLRIVVDMGNFFFREGMDDEALECYKKLSLITRPYSDSEVVSVSKAYFKMGEIFRARSQFEGAIICFENAYVLQKDIFGEVHSANMTLLYHAARSHLKIANQQRKDKNFESSKESYSQALFHFKKALAINRSTVGQSDDDAIDICRRMAYANMRIFNLEDALHSYSQAIDLLKSTNGSSADIESLLKLKGNAHVKNLEYGKAITCFDETLNLLRTRTTLTKDNPDVLDMLTRAAPLYWKEGRYDETIDCYNEIIQIGLASQELTVECMAEIHFKLGRLNKFIGKSKAAIDCYLEAKRCFKKSFADDHPKIGIVLHRLGNLYFDCDTFGESTSSISHIHFAS